MNKKTTYSEIYNLVADANLTPGKSIVTHTNKNPIIALHCIEQPKSEVVFRLDSGKIIKFPPGAFVQGAIYPYKIIQINKEGARCFFGLAE